MRRRSSILAIRVRSVETLNFVENFNCFNFFAFLLSYAKIHSENRIGNDKEDVLPQPSISRCYKTFCRKSRFTKINEIEKKFVLMSEPAFYLMWKQCYFRQNYTLKLCIAFKMAYSCCFSLGENPDNVDFLQKSFITLTSGAETVTLTVNHTIVISFNLCVWKICSWRWLSTKYARRYR